MISGEFDFLDLTPSQGVFFLKGMDLKEEYLQELARCIHLAVENEFGKTCYLAVSGRIEGGEDMGNAYRQAERSLEERFFYQDSYVYPRRSQAEQETVKISDGQLLQAIEKDVACRDGYSLRRNVEILMEVCRNNGFQSYIYTRFVCASLIKILVKELSDGRDLLAEKAFRTPHYLSSIFIQEKGIGINKYIKNVRMEKARVLLKGTNMKISDICEQVGYGSVSYFCRSFRNEYGVTPEQYRW